MGVMKTQAWRAVTGAFLAVLLLAVLFACERADPPVAVGAEVTEAQAEEAFMVAFGGAYVGSMAAQFGQPLPGLSLDMEDESIVFDEFDVSELDTDYRTISGTVKSTEEAAEVDFVMTGGVVETIAFRIGAEQMAAADGIRASVTVNGHQMDIRIDPEAE